jgi:Tol biopolymer transport system component
MKRAVLAVVVLAALVSGCVSDSFTGTTITGNEIVFSSDKESTGNELYLMNDDGTDARRLTYNSMEDNNPAFSPDKKRIAFHRASDPTDFTSYEIYVLDLETGKETRITENAYLDGHPDWSPDGKRLVFARFETGDYADLYIVDLETGEETQLTDTPLYDENDPEWSPDGKYIAYKSTQHTNQSGREEIYLMNADGTDARRLTNTTGWQSDHDPSWSADSRYIYFERYEGGSVPWYMIQDTYYFLTNWQELVPWNVYRVDLEGTEERVTDCSYICWLPVSYRDRIMFLKDDFGLINNTLISIKVEYATIMPDGSNESLLLKDDAYAFKKSYFDF